MHEATVTIIEIAHPTNPRAPSILKVDNGTGRPLKLKAWPDLSPSKWQAGDTLDFTWESEDKSYDGRPYQEHTIRTARRHLMQSPIPRAAAAPQPADVGPHVAMWEKLVSKLLSNGMPEEEIPIHGITCRRLARKILQADIDGKLPELKPRDDLNDNLEF